jgi:hypothetical protein
MSETQDKKFQSEMQSYLRGETECTDPTLKHFLGRFGDAQKELESVGKSVQGLEAQLADGRTTMTKLQGFLEGVAVDLRLFWDKQQGASPEIIEGE